MWGLRYREIGARLDELVGLLDDDPQPAPARAHHPGGSVGEAAPGTWRRAPWLDAVEYDDELVLMVGAEVRVLAGLGLLLWLALDVPRTPDELVADDHGRAGRAPGGGRRWWRTRWRCWPTTGCSSRPMTYLPCAQGIGQNALVNAQYDDLQRQIDELVATVKKSRDDIRD